MWREMLIEAASAAQGPEPAAALPLIDRLLSAKPGNADALTLAGIVAQRTDRIDDAVKAFRAACDAEPRNPGRHQNLGIALKNKGDYPDALDAFAIALELRPGHPATLANLGSCLIAAERYEEALAVLRDALLQAPDNVDALNNLGVALARTGRHQAAVTQYSKALAIRAGHLETTLNLVDALAAVGQCQEAETLVGQVLHTQPRIPRAANQLGLLRESAGDFPGAANVMGKAFDPDAPNHALGVNLARTLIRADKPEDALHVCRALASYSPRITTPLALALAAYERLGRHEERDALMALDRFVSVHDIGDVEGFAHLAQFNSALITELRSHPSLTFEPEGLVTRQGLQSGDIADAQTPALRALADVAKSQLASALARFASDAGSHPFLSASPTEWSLTLWGTILRPGGEVGAHIHAPNWLSGVYYPEFHHAGSQDDEGAFAIGVLPAELGGGGHTTILQPRAGRMILFPSYLWHATLPFGGDQERISFAFDLVPADIGQPHRLR